MALQGEGSPLPNLVILQRVDEDFCSIEVVDLVNEELYGALQRLVVAFQLEHVLTTSSGTACSASVSRVGREGGGWGSVLAASQALDSVVLQTGIAHSLTTLFHDQRLRRFVVVWIATALTSARVDVGSLADATERFSQSRACRVGWAAEGACIALVAALKATETDAGAGIKSITDAFSCLVAHYYFSKSFDLQRLTLQSPSLTLRSSAYWNPEIEEYTARMQEEKMMQEKEKQERERKGREIRKTLQRKEKYKRMALEIQTARKFVLVSIVDRIKEELHGALQRLVVAIQLEHVLATASGTACSASASRVGREGRGWGSVSAASQALDSVDLQTGIAHSLTTLFHDQRLRRFVVVWIATALTSARVDCMGSLAYLVRLSQSRACRVGWAAEGACIALVAALKAAETDAGAGIKSITDAFSCLVAHYYFSKTMKWIAVSVKVKTKRNKRKAARRRQVEVLKCVQEEFFGINEELHGALQRLVVAIQLEHVLATASGTACSASASRVGREGRGWGSVSAASQALDSVVLQIGIAHSLSTLFHDERLRRFVVVWIATALTSARVDVGSLADATERFSQSRACRVGWAAEGACIALVAALKATETDAGAGIKSITDAFSCLVAHYYFSKSFYFEGYSLTPAINSLMNILNLKSPDESNNIFDLMFDGGFASNLRWRLLQLDGLFALTNFDISRMFWDSALDSMNSGSLSVFSRAFLALFRKAQSDRARNVLSRVLHAHCQEFRVINYRRWLHRRLGWYQDHSAHVHEWKPTIFHGSACYVKLLDALAADGALAALTQALNSAEKSSTRACVALAISALVSTSDVGRGADSRRLVLTAAAARDALRSALHKVWINERRHELDEWTYALYHNGKPYDSESYSQFQSIQEHEIIAGALYHLCSTSTAQVHDVKVEIKLIPQTKLFAFYGNHWFSGGGTYSGQWTRIADDSPPHPNPNELGVLRGHINGKMHGKGVMLYRNGDSYKGQWIDGRKGGKGIYKWKNGDFFEGDWMEGMPEVVITKEYLHRCNRAKVIQTSIRRHLSRPKFQQQRSNILFHGRLILNGRGEMKRGAFTKSQLPYFARPLAALLAQVGCTWIQQLALTRFCARSRAAWPLLHAARGYARGCLSAINQPELCRNRCSEVVFIARRLVLQAAQLMPTLHISTRSLFRFSGIIVERVFCGYCRRVCRCTLPVEKPVLPDGMEEVD